jgi:tetratricopeptide (TPR) repeat protein
MQSGDDGTIVLDLRRATIALNSRILKGTTPKTFAFVCLLAWARRHELGGNGAWVTRDQVAALPEWQGVRKPSSLNAHIRREVRRVNHLRRNIIETPARSALKGPFRLRLRPTLSSRHAGLLDHRFGSGIGTPELASTIDLLNWLEAVEPIWRGWHSFDKKKVALSESPSNMILLPGRFALGGAQVIDVGAAASTLGHIDQARRLREMGATRKVHLSLESALQTAEKEVDPQIRMSLRAASLLQKGWLFYSRGKIPRAWTSLQAVFDLLKGDGHLRIRAQALSLRSLMLRQKGDFRGALDDVRLAARCWLVEMDLYHLFSVFHNLGCLLAEQAEEEADPTRQLHLREEAIRSCQRSFDYCREYSVGLNSVLPKIQIANLKTKIGSLEDAKRYADEAFEYAMSKGNLPEARLAHYQRIKVRMVGHQWGEAQRVHTESLRATPSPRMREDLSRDFVALRERLR